MIKCTQCGFDNLPGHLYCTKCKSRLNLEQITREYFLNQRKRFNYGRQILLGMGFLAAAALVLALWPDQADTVKASVVEQKEARTKLNLLQQGTAKEPVVFSEKEVNILFNHLIQELHRRPDHAAGLAAVYAARVTIKPKTLIVHLSCQLGPWMLGPITIGPFWLTYKVTGAIERWTDGLRFTAINGAVGHLPLPLLGKNLGMTRLKRLFLPFRNARSFLSGLEIVELRKGSITVSGAH